MTLTIDLGDITRARSDMPLLSDLRTALPHLRRTLDAVEERQPFVAPYDAAETETRPTGGPPRKRIWRRRPAETIIVGTQGVIIPALHIARDAHGCPPSLDIDPEMVEEWLIRFLRDEMGRRGFGKAVVGLSGGVDSAVTAYLAARAIGAENVLGVRLPYRTSSPDSLAHAQLVVDKLQIPTRTIDLSAAADGYLALEPTADGTRRGNVIARLRMIALFDLSAAIGGVPLGTGNKTERLFGYFTWHADDSPPLNPLGDLFKTQVWALARHLGVPRRRSSTSRRRPTSWPARPTRRTSGSPTRVPTRSSTGCCGASPRPTWWRAASPSSRWSSFAIVSSAPIGSGSFRLLRSSVTRRSVSRT